MLFSLHKIKLRVLSNGKYFSEVEIFVKQNRTNLGNISQVLEISVKQIFLQKSDISQTFVYFFK